VGGTFINAAGIATADRIAKWALGSLVGAPGAPTGVTAVATPSNGTTMHVTWTAPASYGGSVITGYTATAAPGGKTCTWTTGSLDCNITSITHDGLYTVTVTATNGTRGPASTASAAVRIDTAAPTVSAPSAGLVTGSRLGTSSVPVRLAWSGSDTGGSGVGHYEVGLSTNGGAFVALALGSPTATSLTRSFSPSTTTAYRVRVRSVDVAGNASGWVTGASFHVKLVQQSSSAVHYTGTWTKTRNNSASGHTYKSKKRTKAKATYSFTGRAIGLVAFRSASLGKVKVYIDGVYKGTVNLHASSTSWRRIMDVRTTAGGRHTIKLICVGTAGHPKIDLDAFVVLE
jgi:hypothetical protein